jgi:hypothetical protein
MLHDGHVVLVTMKKIKIKLLFNKLGILNDYVKHEKGLDCFWAYMVVTIRKYHADVMLVH